MSVLMSEAPMKKGYTDAEKHEVFNREFMPHIDSMYNFAFRLTTDEDDANDLVQDTYLKAFRFISSFEQGTNAKAWLFRILKNSFINDYRTVIILCDIEGFTYEEMAKILDIPIGTVRSRLHRARNLLKEKLRNYAGSMGYDA